MSSPRSFKIPPKYQQGFSLIELMISIVLSLLLVLGVGSIFLASNKTMQASQASSKIQENARLMMELLNRDLREAGGNPCSSQLEIGSSLNNQTSPYWDTWKGGLRGYTASQATAGTAFGNGVGQRVPGTDAIDVFASTADVVNITSKMTAGNSPLTVSSNNLYSTNDLAFVCDTSVGFLFQVSGRTATQLQHNDTGSAPGNCARVFSYTDSCNNLATGYLFDKNATVGKVSATRWYIGNNEDGTRSLFRASLSPNGASDSTVSSVTEIAKNVQNMNIEYLQRGNVDYADATSIGNWKNVMSVKVTYTIELQQTTLGIRDGRTITRAMTQVVALRNRQ